jgi:hypothetical protein
VSETRFADPPAASGLASRTATEPVGFQTIEQVSSFAEVGSEWDGLVRAAVARVATLSLRTHLKDSPAALRAYDTAAPLVRRMRVPREVLPP